MEEDLKQRVVNLVKVVLFGPESTGKTTLASLLAEHYETVWVPEFARDYLQEKFNRTQIICEYSDLLPIAKGQMRLENELAMEANRVLICDTDLLETQVYSEQYYEGRVDPLLRKYAELNTYDLYLLTDIDVPWEPDDLRDRPHQREEMFRAFEQALIDFERDYIRLSGSQDQRMEMAIDHIDRLLKNRFHE
jgi:NadR type nicotinamide-nucleotide adenylyltransferase